MKEILNLLLEYDRYWRNSDSDLVRSRQFEVEQAIKQYLSNEDELSYLIWTLEQIKLDINKLSP